MNKLLKKFNLTADKTDLKSLCISFALINFVFLYNTLNFLWGNHDVKFVKDGLELSSGLFEGRFTQFIPHVLLTNGEILPILNNFLGFFFLTIGLWILAKYWDIKKTCLNYVLFITFFATIPYTLSWLYFTFITLSCLLWVFFAILGLQLSAYIANSHHKTILTFISALFFYLPLGGYPPVINTIAVCLMAKICFTYLFENKRLCAIIKTYQYTVYAVLIAAFATKLTLKIIEPDNVYNLEMMPFAEIPQKLISIIKISVIQFGLSQPFMEIGYKIIMLIMVLTAITGAILKANTITKRLTTLALLILTVLAAATTTFLVIPHTEYVSRIDFYGIAFVYNFTLALLLKFKLPLARSLALIFMLILIPFNLINDYRAQKIWQQGQTAEFQILDNLMERIESHPNFDANQKYHFRQLGDISMRPRYYKQNFAYNEPFLLALPYLAMWQGARLVEFFSPYEYIDQITPLSPSDITPELHQFMMTTARPWPDKDSIYVGNNVIIVIFSQNELDEFRKMIEKLN